MPIGLEDMMWAEEKEVARQVAVEVEMMVEAVGQLEGVEEVTQPRPVLVIWVRSCRRMNRRRGTYRSRLVKMAASPPCAHQTLEACLCRL
jgi:hypothetical protein